MDAVLCSSPCICLVISSSWLGSKHLDNFYLEYFGVGSSIYLVKPVYTFIFAYICYLLASRMKASLKTPSHSIRVSWCGKLPTDALESNVLTAFIKGAMLPFYTPAMPYNTSGCHVPENLTAPKRC